MKPETWKELAKWALISLISVLVFHINSDTARIYAALQAQTAIVENHERRISTIEGTLPGAIKKMDDIHEDIKDLTRAIINKNK